MDFALQASFFRFAGVFSLVPKLEVKMGGIYVGVIAIAAVSIGVLIVIAQRAEGVTPGIVLVAMGIILLAILAVSGFLRVRDVIAENAQDHAKLQLLESQLARQQEIVDSLADGLDVAIFLLSSGGVVEFANRSAIQMFRFEGAVGRSILEVTLSHDLENLVLETARSKRAMRGEVVFRYPEERTGLAQAWSEVGEDRVYLSVYEITELKRLERVRRDFVANVSHELRTPMTTIRAMAETMRDAEGDAEAPALRKRYLAKIEQEVDRLTLISDDLLTLSAAEASQTVDKQPHDLAQLAALVLSDFRPKAKAKGIELKLEGQGTLNADINEHQVSQVLANLVDNAIKYTDTGSVVVDLAAENGQAVITVTDTGIGIPTDHQPRIFERFYRVDKARSRESGGTGLGLSIVKHIVEAHGGKVSVESEMNRGSTFTVRLPAAAGQ